MLFNSYAFLFGFLPLVLLAFWLVVSPQRIGFAVWVLGVASVVFYGIGQPEWVPLLLTSIVVNFFAGRAILQSCTLGSRRTLLIVALVFNLGALAYFKYLMFAVLTVNAVSGLTLSIPAIVLPVGISFFTFTQIAYIIDCYRGEARAYRFDEYLLFVTFFPHLVAGPILNHKSIIPQLEQPAFVTFNAKNMICGVMFFSFGLFKKLVIADAIAPDVTELFANAQALTMIECWAAALFYTFQLYFDFSGYSDMAVGLGLMFNVVLPFNFNSPYKSESIVEFWRRWHMSLSAFLRDYLYIPLGGNRHGEPRRHLNLLITMVLGGLWHGAGWTFVVWGALHGAALSVNHLARRAGVRLPRPLAWFVTMVFVVVAWVVFRAASIGDAFYMVTTMFDVSQFKLPRSWHWIGAGIGLDDRSFMPVLPHLPYLGRSIVILTILAAWCLLLPNSQEVIARWAGRKWLAFVAAVIAFVSVLSVGRQSVFLYFQF